ncbi:MAG: RNA methyltransferase [Planctomycetota bacterium]|nr:MAG: RNA methyltransferase [Planctomycetota bacterium]
MRLKSFWRYGTFFLKRFYETNMLGVPLLSKRRQKWIVALHRKKMRQIHQAFLAEGPLLIQAALKLHRYPQLVVISPKFSDKHSLLPLLQQQNIPLFSTANSKQFEQLANTQTPQGILGVFSLARSPFSQLLKTTPPAVLLLDRIQDPGNLGTLLRTAWALGFQGAILCKGCVDAFQPKTVRASMGAVFALTIIQIETLEETIPSLKQQDYLLATSQIQGGIPPEQLPSAHRYALLLGNEKQGVRPSLASLCDISLTIPQQKEADSLNVASAASILMYFMANKIKNTSLLSNL